MATVPDDVRPDRRTAERSRRPADRSRRPTAADVARQAGLSRTTVSYVLNDTPHQVIPDHTRQRMLTAARELGYTPSAAARALSSGRSEVVLLLLPDWPIGPSVGEILDGLSVALGAAGLTFVAHPRSADRPVSEVWKALTPAAVITFEELGESEAAMIRAAGVDLAVALFGRSGDHALEFPEQRLGRLQAEHLAAAGHRHLGYAWPDDPRVFSFAEPRLEGVRQACTELGLDPPVVVTVPVDVAAAAEALRTWRAADPAVTGICAYNDDVALALLAGAQRDGLTVPTDVAVVGSDDIAAAAVSIPPLTTVRADSRALTEWIAASIIAKLADGPEPSAPNGDVHRIVRRDSA